MECPTDKAKLDIYDLKTEGLVLTVYPSGKKTYFMRIRGLQGGVFQDSCRKNHAAFLKFFCVGLSGLSVTSATGVQFRVLPDQRVGCLSLAAA